MHVLFMNQVILLLSYFRGEFRNTEMKATDFATIRGGSRRGSLGGGHTLVGGGGAQ